MASDENCTKNGASRTPTEGKVQYRTTRQWEITTKNKESVSPTMALMARHAVIENDYRVRGTGGWLDKEQERSWEHQRYWGGTHAVNKVPSPPEGRGTVLSAWQEDTAPAMHASSTAQTLGITGERRGIRNKDRERRAAARGWRTTRGIRGKTRQGRTGGITSRQGGDSGKWGQHKRWKSVE